MTDVIIQAEP